MLKIGQKIELEVEKLSFKGGGVCRLNHFTIFVESTAPGEKILAEVFEVEKNFARAKLIKILEASPHRISPPCPVFGRCGGCQWQHLEESQQIFWKQHLVQEILERNLHTSIPMLNFVSGQKKFHYRNRAQFKVQNGKVGYYQKKSHSLVEIDNCLIVDPQISEQMVSLKNKEDGNWEISLNQQGKAVVGLPSERDNSFSQVNTEINAKIQQNLYDRILKNPDFPIWDLYCGDGNWAFDLFQKLSPKKMLGVELSGSSIRRAHLKQEQMKISLRNLSFYQASVEAFLERHAPPPQAIVLLDPPRAGVHPLVMNCLRESQAQQIFYISCNPATLARDLAILTKPSKWELKAVQVFDMFPQTDHVEVVVELRIDTSK